MSLSDFSSPAESGGGAPQANPSVSKTQWANYALRKLREGYVLLQMPSGRAYNFYRAGEPMQPCAPHAAKKLIAMGLVTVLRSDIRGTQYALREAFQPDEAAA
jgi:predicted component of type VI protein secretion system